MILPVGKTGENITSSYMTTSLPWMSLWDVGWISFSCACVLSWSVPVGTSLCIFSVHPSKGQRVEEKKMVSPAAGFALPAGGQVLLPVVSPSFPSSQGPRHLMDVSLFFIFTPPPRHCPGIILTDCHIHCFHQTGCFMSQRWWEWGRSRSAHSVFPAVNRERDQLCLETTSSSLESRDRSPAGTLKED